jgi:hypothetical protein
MGAEGLSLSAATSRGEQAITRARMEAVFILKNYSWFLDSARFVSGLKQRTVKAEKSVFIVSLYI